jgi:hypothetical protein
MAAMLGAGIGSARAEVGGWEFAVTPYLWLTEMKGDISAGGKSAPVDISFGDTIDAMSDLKAALMIHGEARRGNFSGLTDIYAITLREKKQTGVGDSDTRVSEYIGELAGAYALTAPDSKVKVEALAGGRYQMVRTRIILDDVDVDIDKNKGFADPFVGGRVMVAATEDVTISLRGDIGGFGIGSDLTWNVIGAASWAFAEKWSAVVAYRYLDTDYDNDGFKYNVHTDGPALGVTYTF